jgi:hypothetical protein
MELDPLLLARLQFPFTFIYHIIFPAFTTGLSAYSRRSAASRPQSENNCSKSCHVDSLWTWYWVAIQVHQPPWTRRLT